MAAALVFAVGTTLALTQALMSPPAGEMRELAMYLVLAGATTTGAGWLALRITGSSAKASLRTKAFVSATIGSAVALLNVFIVAQFMFVSTTHDLRLLMALLVFSGVITLGFTMWVAATISDRIGAVGGAIEKLASGAYDTRASVTGADEVALLARDVNVLAGRLQAADDERAAIETQRRELTAAISHDLRTPLASMKAMVEALDDGVLTDAAEVTRYYSALRREADRLSRMIDDLFELARMDAGAVALDLQPLTLHEIAADVVDAMQAHAMQRGVELELLCSGPPATAMVDGMRIARAVANLLQNALEHTPAGGHVRVVVENVAGDLRLTVGDSGAGIAPGDIERIWERFYRADRSRHSVDASSGSGLGLAIVRGIVEAHGGRVDAGTGPEGGALFTISVPGG